MKMKILSADEKTAYYFFFVLDKIKEGVNPQAESKKPVIYSVILLPALNDPYKPNSITEQKIISMLIREGAIEEVEEKSDFQIHADRSNNPKSAGFHYYLKINKPKFDTLYHNYQKLVKQYETAENIGNTLTFHTDGRVEYVSPQGKAYSASFGRKTNQYKLLQFLTKNPFQLFSFDELGRVLNPARLHAEETGNERRVRNTVKEITDKIGYKGDELIVSDYGFGLQCDVSIKK